MPLRVHIILADSRDEMNVQVIKPQGDRNAKAAMEVVSPQQLLALDRDGREELLLRLGYEIGHADLLEELR